MAWFGRKKEEKKKFDYSDETKELFAERDAWTAEQRRKLGGETSNPELANQPNSEAPKSRTGDLDDLLGGSDGFDPMSIRIKLPQIQARVSQHLLHSLAVHRSLHVRLAVRLSRKSGANARHVVVK